MLTEEELIENEYELQYFGFSSSQFYSDYCCMAQKWINQTLTELKNILKEKADEDEAEEIVKKLGKLYWNAAQEPLQNIKDEIRGIFKIPSSILTQNNKLIESKDKEIELLTKEVEALEMEYLKEIFFLTKLKKCQENMAEIKSYYENADSVLKIAQNILNNEQISCNKDFEKTIEMHKKSANLLFPPDTI